MDDLLQQWRARFGDRPPGARAWGIDLPGDLRACMVRFHSLPGGKRYAECVAERDLILSRQNDHLDQLLGEGTPYALLYTRYGDPEEMHASAYEAHLDERLVLLYTLEPGHCTPPPFFDWRPDWSEVSLYARVQPWRRGAEDALLAAIADDELAGTLIFRPDNGALFAPYDGGWTVVAASVPERERLAAQYADWLPGQSAEDTSLVVSSALPAERDTVRWLKETLGAVVYLHPDGAVKTVKIDHADADDDRLGRIGELTDLQTLLFCPTGPDDDDNPRVTDRGVLALQGLAALEGLNLSGFPRVTPRGIEALRATLTGCAIEVW